MNNDKIIQEIIKKENKKARVEKIYKIVIPILSILIFFILWQLIVKIFSINSFLLPAPLDIIKSFIKNIDILFNASIATFLESFIGLILAFLIGSIIALIMDLFKTINFAIYPILVISQMVPIIALAPIVDNIFGFDITSKLFIVLLMCFFPITLAFLNGLKNIEKNYIEEMKCIGTNKFQLYKDCKIPFAMFSLFSGLRIAATYSVAAAVTAEFIGSSKGLGNMMLHSSKSYNIPLLFSSVIMSFLLSFFINFIVYILYKIFCKVKKGEI